ncbi:MAG: exodeoxyribonuclease VII small subunit [Bacteroidetes bacterium]|nr:exodeoxyribonuclease VII small subunit [Bacteroidota bacterium]
MMNESPEPQVSIDTLIKRIESISKTLAEGSSSLESSIDQYEEGVRLAKECLRRLGEAEQRVTQLRDALESDSNEPETPDSELFRID